MDGLQTLFRQGLRIARWQGHAAVIKRPVPLLCRFGLARKALDKCQKRTRLLRTEDLAQIGTRARASDQTGLPLELGQASVRCRIMDCCDEELPQTDQWLQIGVARSGCDACQRVFPALCAPLVAEGHPAGSG